MGFERNYQIKNLSNQLNKKQCSTLSPRFFTGLIDTKGLFTTIINKNLNSKIDWIIQSKFQMGLQIRDLNLLKIATIFRWYWNDT